MIRRFQFSLATIFVITRVVAMWAATWATLFGLWIALGTPLAGYLLAKFLWLLPDRD
jgi:hypothetical protein